MSINFDRNKLKQLFALISLVALGLFLVYALNELLVGTLGAIILYVLFKPYMQKLVVEEPNKKSLYAFLIMLLSFLILLLPAIISINLMYTKVYEIMNSEDANQFNLRHINSNLRPWLGYDLFSQKTVQILREKTAAFIPDLIGGTATVVLNIVIMYFLLFYMLIYTGKMEKHISSILPFSEENAALFYKELEIMTYSNAIVVPLIALAQGFCTTLILLIVGVDHPIFWGFLTALLSFVPFVGTALVWAPLGVFFIARDHIWEGIVILIFGIIVISHIDYVLRLMVQKRYGNVHPLITVLGIIAGLKLFSLPGVIFGPLLISYFIIFVKMYQKEYAHNGKSHRLL